MVGGRRGVLGCSCQPICEHNKLMFLKSFFKGEMESVTHALKSFDSKLQDMQLSKAVIPIPRATDQYWSGLTGSVWSWCNA